MTKSVVGQTDWGADLTIIFNQALEKINQMLLEMKKKKKMEVNKSKTAFLKIDFQPFFKSTAN